MEKQLTFGLDFDNTFTACPALMAWFVEKGRSLGHRFILVTARRNTLENQEEVDAFLDHWQCQMIIVFSNLGSKIVAVEKAGYKVDIWLDDDPKSLVHGM